MEKNQLIDEIRSGMTFDRSLTFAHRLTEIAERCQEILIDYFRTNNLDYDYEPILEKEKFAFDSNKNAQLAMTDSLVSFYQKKVRDFASFAVLASNLYAKIKDELWQRKRMQYLGIQFSQNFEPTAPNPKEFLISRFGTADFAALVTHEAKNFEDLVFGGIYKQKGVTYTVGVRSDQETIVSLHVDVKTEKSDVDILEFMNGAYHYFSQKIEFLRKQDHV